MKNLKFSILIPVHNVEKTIKETLLSIKLQNYKNFEVIIQDNASSDNTAKIVKSMKFKKIKYFKNHSNLGYSNNLTEGKKNCKGDIIFLMAGDDILDQSALLWTYKAFCLAPNIGAVTRPYYWFQENINKPVRIKNHIDWKKNEIVRITDSEERVFKVMSTIDQLSGLAFRRKFMKLNFSKEPWIAHGYPFLAIFKHYPIVFLKDFTVAVRIHDNATRSNIYSKSPIQNWVNMINRVLYEPQFDTLRKTCIKNFVAKHYIGLIQIKNYGSFNYLLREIFLLVKYRWENILSPFFWLIVLITIGTPSVILRPLTDWYKNFFNSRLIGNKVKRFKFKV